MPAAELLCASQMPAAERENGPLDYPQSQRRRQKACVICNKRKIRCNLIEGSAPCTNCRVQNYICMPHKRRQRHPIASSLSPPTSSAFLKARSSNGREPAIGPGLGTGHSNSLKSTEPPTSHHGTDGSSSVVGKGAFDSRPQPEAVQYANSAEDRATSSPAITVTSRCGFIGHPELVAGDLETDNVSDRVPPPHRSSRSAAEMAVLRLYGALHLPTRAIRDSLISNFKTYCDPWMPIVESSELKTLGLHVTEPSEGQGLSTSSDSSLLLAQALFVAGSRVHSPRFSFASCSEFYDRAKALFFAEYESNPLTTIRALCLLQWYNPSGPEFVSIHSSSFWLRTAVGLAFQIGLHREPDLRRADCGSRRRLFWTLYSRDCILSTAHGRPRAINLDDCNIRWPTIHDFPPNDRNGKRARLFLAYVDICAILGRLGRASLPDGHLRSQRKDIGGALYRWISQLPPELQLTAGADFDLEVRQLYLLYFTSISILYGPGPSADGCSAAAILASSCVARTLEDFLARDKLRYLIPTVPYYLLVAGLSQLACYRFPALLELTKSELNIIRSSLLELGKIWHSAREKLHILDRFLAIANSGSGSGAHADPVKHLDISREQLSYFEMFPPELCPKWEIIVSGNYAEQPQSFSQDTLVGPIIGNEGWAALVPENQLPLETTISTTGAATRRPDRQLNLTTNGLRGSEVDWVFPDIDGRWEDFNDMLESSAGWLLQGWETNIV